MHHQMQKMAILSCLKDLQPCIVLSIVYKIRNSMSMFSDVFKQILEAEAYIDTLSTEQISNIKNKEFFYAAQNEPLQQCPPSPSGSESSHSSSFLQQAGRPLSRMYKANEILKQVMDVSPHSYEQIQQIEHRMSVLANTEFDQLEELKLMYEKDKAELKTSNLKVKDFLHIYESENIGGLEMNNALVKKIVSYFQTNTKEYTVHELLEFIMKYLQTSESSSWQSPSFHEDATEFEDDDIKNEMEKMMVYYGCIDKIFSFEK